MSLENLGLSQEGEIPPPPLLALEGTVLHVHVSVSFAKYGTLTALTIFGHKRGANEFVGGDRSFWGNA